MTLSPPFALALSGGMQSTAVRVPSDADPAEVASVLNVPPSSGVFVLSGGAEGMTDSDLEKITATFQELSKVLALRGVTVLDGGTRSGVMAMMGSALAHSGHSAPYIGVLPVHADGRDQPLKDMLDPNRSHFVLVDSDEWGGEVPLLYGLTQYLSQGAPSLALLANGGNVALMDIEQNVQQGREIVILAGSGRLADEITASHKSSWIGQFSRLWRWNLRERSQRVAAIAEKGNLTFFDLSDPPEQLAELIAQRYS